MSDALWSVPRDSKSKICCKISECNEGMFEMSPCLIVWALEGLKVPIWTIPLKLINPKEIGPKSGSLRLRHPQFNHYNAYEAYVSGLNRFDYLRFINENTLIWKNIFSHILTKVQKSAGLVDLMLWTPVYRGWLFFFGTLSLIIFLKSIVILIWIKIIPSTSMYKDSMHSSFCTGIAI